MSQDPRTFNKEDKVTWDELADSLQKLITQIKTDLANEIIDRKTACEKLQKEIDALFDKDGHLVFPNGNTLWIDANNGTLPSTGTGSGVTEVSDVTFDQLDSNMQDRLNDDKAGIAQALSEIEELKKSIQANADEITKLKAQLAASGAAAAAGGGGLFVDYPSGIVVASGRDELSYEFTAAEDCAISITCDYEGAHIAGTFTGTLRVNATATSLGPNTLAGGFLFFKKGDTVLIDITSLTSSNADSSLSIIQYKLRSGNNGMKLNFGGRIAYGGSYESVYTIPEDGFITAGGASNGSYLYVKINGTAICDTSMGRTGGFLFAFGSVPVSKGDKLTCNENTVVYFFPLAH